MHPLCTRLGSNEMQLTPRILRFIRLLPPPPHFAAFTQHSGQVAMNICIQLWPSKATGQFVRHISSPFPSRSCISFLPPSSFFLFFSPFFVFFYSFFARQVKNKRNRRDKPLPFTRRRFNERLNTISKILDCLPFLNFEASQVIKETIINSNR